MKGKVTIEHLYWYLLILLLVNNWWGDLSVFNEVYQIYKPIVLSSSAVIFFLLLIKYKYVSFELLSIPILLGAGIYTAYLIGSKWTIYAMILVAFARKVNIEKTIHIIYRCMSIFIVIAVILFIAQCIFAPSSLDVYVDDTSVKYSMTFMGANEAARYWIYWFMLFSYVNMEKKTHILKKILIMCVTIFFYVCTLSDTLLLIGVLAFFKRMKGQVWFEKIICKYSGYSFGIICMFCLLLLNFENTFIFEILDKYATGRFGLGVLGFEKYKMSILGQPGIEFYKWIVSGNGEPRRLVLDNAYYMISIYYGIFYVVLIAFLFWKSRKRMDYRGGCCMIAYAVYAIAANTILSPTGIFPVIIAANLCWKTERRKERLIYEYFRTGK